jgi:hypothetical protein
VEFSHFAEYCVFLVRGKNYYTVVLERERERERESKNRANFGYFGKKFNIFFIQHHIALPIEDVTTASACVSTHFKKNF